MVVLHALSEYLVKKPPAEDLSLDVDVRIRGRKEIRYFFDPSSAYAARSSRVSERARTSERGLHLLVIARAPCLLVYFIMFIAACWSGSGSGGSGERTGYTRGTLARTCNSKHLQIDLKWTSLIKVAFIASRLLRLQVVTFYNQLHEVEEKKPCEHFELDVSIEESSGNILFSPPKCEYEYKDNNHTRFYGLGLI